MQKRDFHPTFLLFEGPCVAEKNFAYPARSFLGAHLSEIRGRQRKTRGRQSKI